MKRRDFLRLMPTGILLPGLLPGYSLKALNLSSLFYPSFMDMDNDHVLVIVRLNGGNDGLNTVIPLSNYSDYISARQNLAIPESKVLNINGIDRAGLHPSMNRLKDMYDEEKLGIIQSVGYPNPNFSHFRSTDIWMSASNSDQHINTGWAGRCLDYLYPDFPDLYPNANMQDPLAIQIGLSTQLISQGPVQNMAISISNPDSFYELLNGDTGPAPDTNAGNELTFVRNVSKQTNHYGKQIVNAADKVNDQFSGYPEGNTLADQLKICARLIKGGLKTRIYMVTIGGFDTHANQTDVSDTTQGLHATLLINVSEAIWAFQQDLKFLEIEDRVLGMTYSEFGRRIMSNASQGTDHGAAAPMFVFGTHAIMQMLGENPDLTNADNKSNIPYLYDFRSLYASIMEQWLCIDFSNIEDMFIDPVNSELQSIPVVKNSACSPVSTEKINHKEPEFKLYPNPFSNYVEIDFESMGGNVNIQVLDSRGRLISTIASGNYPSGNNSIEFTSDFLPPGTYYFRFQNGKNVATRSGIKHY